MPYNLKEHRVVDYSHVGVVQLGREDEGEWEDEGGREDEEGGRMRREGG